MKKKIVAIMACAMMLLSAGASARDTRANTHGSSILTGRCAIIPS